MVVVVPGFVVVDFISGFVVSSLDPVMYQDRGSRIDVES
jgi:hypothetical protein